MSPDLKKQIQQQMLGGTPMSNRQHLWKARNSPNPSP